MKLWKFLTGFTLIRRHFQCLKSMVWSIKFKIIVKIAIHLSAFLLFFNFLFSNNVSLDWEIFTIHSRGCVILEEVGVVPKMLKFISSKFIIPTPWNALYNFSKNSCKNHMDLIMINLDSEKKSTFFRNCFSTPPLIFVYFLLLWSFEKTHLTEKILGEKRIFFFSKICCRKHIVIQIFLI